MQPGLSLSHFRGKIMNRESEEKKSGQPAQPPSRRKIAVTTLLVLVVCAVAVAFFFWRRAQIYVRTDDAYVHGHIHSISSRVPGTISEVLVTDNESVVKDQLLVRLDPATFEAAVRDSEAALELARNEVAQMQAAVQVAEARLAHARATLNQAEVDLRRAEELARSGIASKEAHDKATTSKRVSEAAVRAAQEELQRARAALGSVEGMHPLVLKRQAELDEARLNLQYTEIRSPSEGYITRKSAEVGNRIQPGQPLMSVVPLDDIWIVANYKETQLERIKVGQPVEIEVDTYPGVKIKGRVESIMAGTGAVFSLFPPENATGNFVKVVQRVPVKIVLEDYPNPHVLRVGMSVVPTVDTTKD
ncbi:MAG: HlyD family secretion protein [Candidatus Abyssobacteria bacterium SURF_5]|uniref:HlyD family secretion protein n=1 Tax=Abyssobacteria bacterium (strain SURF_5) TaxID=2093360 RepID=A0A3A4NR67_ABYX5|nr:MAG: HlyD family secretion protein [Candidatus Abyssubacteria bacterium SURF_5]